MDSVWSDLEQRCGAVQWSLDQQQMIEKILKGLQMLLNLGREKLTCTSQLEFRNPAQLQTNLSTHTVNTHKILLTKHKFSNSTNANKTQNKTKNMHYITDESCRLRHHYAFTQRGACILSFISVTF